MKRPFPGPSPWKPWRTVLPAGVQVTSIEPMRAKDGHITVHLRVVGPRDRAVDLVANLEHSRRFLEPRIVGENAESSTTARCSARSPISASNRFDFDLLAEYNPPTPEERAANERTAAKSARDGSEPAHAQRRPTQSPLPGSCCKPQSVAALCRIVTSRPSRRPARLQTASVHGRSAMSANGSSSTWRERLASPLTWHFAGFDSAAVLAVGLAVRLGYRLGRHGQPLQRGPGRQADPVEGS